MRGGETARLVQRPAQLITWGPRSGGTARQFPGQVGPPVNSEDGTGETQAELAAAALWVGTTAHMFW